MAPTLDLSARGLGDDAVVELASSSRLHGVRALDLRNDKLSSRAAQALASSAHVEHLESLDLRGNRIGHEGVLALVGASNRLARLQYLAVGSELAPESISALLGGVALPALTSLSLEASVESWIVALSRVSKVERLIRMHVTGLGKDAALLPSLLVCPGLDGVRELSLAVNGHVGSTGAAAIASAPMLGNLQELSIAGYNGIGGRGLAALAASTTLVSLSVLAITENQVTDDGLLALAASERLAGLEELDLTNNPEVYDAGVSAIVSTPRAARLKRLRVGWTGVTARVIRALVDSPFLQALELLDLRRTGINVEESDWVDQGAVIGSTPRDSEVDELRAKFGSNLLI